MVTIRRRHRRDQHGYHHLMSCTHVCHRLMSMPTWLSSSYVLVHIVVDI